MIYLLLILPIILCAVLWLAFGFFGALEIVSNWAIPCLLIFIPAYGVIKKVKVYEEFVEGAKEGFEIAVKIMPYLVAILVAIGLFRDIGLMTAFSDFLKPYVHEAFPPEALPMALIRPLSGGGASGIMNSIFIEHGPDSYIGMLASVMMGSTETTFYVLAVYFGAVNVRNTRHALPAGLVGDVAGLTAAVILSYLAFWPN